MRPADTTTLPQKLRDWQIAYEYVREALPPDDVSARTAALVAASLVGQRLKPASVPPEDE